MTLLSLAQKMPLFGALWTWAAQDPDRLSIVAACCAASTILLALLAWTNDDDGYTFFREPTLGLTGAQIRGLCVFPVLLPLTFHLAPLVLGLMGLYHLLRATAHLGRMIVGEARA